MAEWLKVYNSTFGGVSDATFVVDVENVTAWGFQRYGNAPWVYRITANGTSLEGDYASAEDALAAVLSLTEAHTVTEHIDYSS